MTDDAAANSVYRGSLEHARDLVLADTGDGFTVTLTLARGRTYEFRYLLDGERWENDWRADGYLRNDFGGEDSVVDLSADVMSDCAPADAAPPKKRARTKKVATKAEPA